MTRCQPTIGTTAKGGLNEISLGYSIFKDKHNLINCSLDLYIFPGNVTFTTQ